MRVCYVSNTADNSGAPKMLRLVANAIERRHGDHLQRFIFPLDRSLETAKMLGTVVFDDSLNFSQRVHVAKRALLDEPVDLVFVNTIRMSAFCVAARELGINNVAYIHEMGDSLSFYLRNGYTTLDALDYADRVFWACARARDQWALITGDVLHSYVLESCYTETNFHEFENPVIPVARKAAALRGPSVMSVGTACVRKGFDRFVDIASAFPTVPFVWVGGFDSGDPGQTSTLVAKAREVTNVIVTGSVADPNPLLRNSSILLFLSREDPNPLTIHEAVYNGFNYIAVIDGLGESKLPLRCGAAVAAYERDAICDIVRRALEDDVTNASMDPDYKVNAIEQRRKLSAHLVRTEEHFFEDLYAGMRGLI